MSYTPNTPEVRVDYSQFWGGVAPDGATDAGVAFDRWLASVKAEAWDEGSRSSMFTDAAARNPYQEQP